MAKDINTDQPRMQKKMMHVNSRAMYDNTDFIQVCMCYMLMWARVRSKEAFIAKAIKAHKAQTKTLNKKIYFKISNHYKYYATTISFEGDLKVNTDDYPN